jgi:uncharacterized protein (TIGR00290 family)
MKEKVIVSWSGGKDSAIALYEIQKSNKYKIVSLLTTITRDYDRVSMHGIRRILLERQAESLGLPLNKIFISKNSSNEEYESVMSRALGEYRKAGVYSVVMGDIFLEELRKYREDNLSRIGMKAVFPIWKTDTAELAHRFIDSGFKAIVTCLDSRVMNKRFAGRAFDKQFLGQLPAGVDPCGENGEFHTFVYAGPIFRKEISYTKGRVVLRNKRFYYCDLRPAG